MLTDFFLNFVIARLISKFAIKSSLNTPSQLKQVATLPYESYALNAFYKTQ